MEADGVAVVLIDFIWIKNLSYDEYSHVSFNMYNVPHSEIYLSFSLTFFKI